MKRLSITLLMTLAGCGGLEPYSSCPNLTANEVDATISVARSDYLAGIPYSVEIRDVVSACRGLPIACDACFTAVVDHVYGF